MASHPPGQPRQVYGVDFSGAADAGKKIWITKGMIDGEALRIEACYQGADLPGSDVARDPCLAALRDFIARETDSAIGLDFPFGLPRELVKMDTWEDFAVSFPDCYASPEVFRETCRAATDGSELKRVTDRESHTPFSPYNIRLYRQTYFGISNVLAPVVRDQVACVLPMQTALPDKPWILEICPASTLKREYLYWPYKGKSHEHREGRARILAAIEQSAHLSLSDALRSVILDDPGGDALDSVIAAFAVFRTLRNPAGVVAMWDSVYALEGCVYV
jgi:hypothetical protein